MPISPEKLYDAVELNWPRYADGRYVKPGDVVDIKHIGRLKVREIACTVGLTFTVNGFWVAGLDIEPVEKGGVDEAKHVRP